MTPRLVAVGAAFVRKRRRRGARAVLVLAGLVLGVASVCGVAIASDPLVQEAKGVTIDWRRGKLVAHAAAAGDWRMPTAEVARAGAERRARGAGRARLAEALRALPLGGGRRLEDAAVERALGRARAASVDYQSNGGVELRLEVSFGDWREPSPSPAGAALPGGNDAVPSALVLRLPEGALAAAPVVVVRGKESELVSARYAPASELPSGARAVAIRADKKGRLVVDGDLGAQDFARRDAVIYVQKVVR